MKHLTEEDLVLLYYGDSAADTEADRHLKDCAECRAASESLSRTLNMCNEWTVPEPEPEFPRSVWAQLAPRLYEAKPPVRLGLRRFWLAPALLAVLLGAFLAGRVSKQSESPLMAGLSDQARERILAISLADHLDRAELLLTEISNANETSGDDLSSARYRAQDLVEEGRLLRQTLAHNGDATIRQTSGTASLMDEVDRLILEVANAPDRVPPAEVQALQRRIDAGSLLFKVRIIESNLRTEGLKS
jgi:hypothetical protein